MSDITETMTVKNGQAAVKTVTVAGKLSPKTSATDTIALVETSDGKQAALKVYNINGGGGGGGDYDAEIEALENAVSVLTTSVELSTEIGQTTTVLLDELLTLDVDGRPDYKAPGATVYAENGVTGIIDTIDNSAQTAVVKTVSVSTGGGAGGDYLPLSGGTLTGTLGFDIIGGAYSYVPVIVSYDGTTLMSAATDGTGKIAWSRVRFSQLDVESGMTVKSIGYGYSPTHNIYVKQIGSGKDGSLLNVPDGTGTLARIEDINAAVGDISTALTAILGE